MSKAPKTLYTASDVKSVRSVLLREQNGLDALTGLPLSASDAVCDHDHKTQYVRGILHRQSNALLGKIENLYNRYLSWWYSGSLSDFLRKTADYLDKEHSKEYVHPGWIKRCTIDFCKLTAKQQTDVLLKLNSSDGKNAVERKKIFSKRLLDKEHSYDTISSLLNSVKE